MTSNPQVIEAAERAHGEVRYWRDKEDQAVKADGKPSMERAILAADTARAPAVIAALNAYVTALNQHAGTALLCGPRLTAGSEERVREARRAVLAAAGVVEEPTP